MNKPVALMFFYANAQRVCQMGLGNVRLMVAGRQGVAQLQGTVKLLQVDGGGSILAARGAQEASGASYCPYGLSTEKEVAIVGFNGEPFDLLSECSPLGIGYRYYSPALRRFLSADKASPFGKGGLNAYVYCVDDPVNRADPSGRSSIWNFHRKVPTGTSQVMADIGLPGSMRRMLKHVHEQIMKNDFPRREQYAAEFYSIKNRKTYYVGFSNVNNNIYYSGVNPFVPVLDGKYRVDAGSGWMGKSKYGLPERSSLGKVWDWLTGVSIGEPGDPAIYRRYYEDMRVLNAQFSSNSPVIADDNQSIRRHSDAPPPYSSLFPEE